MEIYLLTASFNPPRIDISVSEAEKITPLRVYFYGGRWALRASGNLLEGKHVYYASESAALIAAGRLAGMILAKQGLALQKAQSLTEKYPLIK